MIEDGRAQTLFLFKLSCVLVGGEGTPFQKFAEEEVYFFLRMFVPYKVIILQATFAFKRTSSLWNDLSTFSSLFGRYIKKEWQDDFEVDIKNILI